MTEHEPPQAPGQWPKPVYFWHIELQFRKKLAREELLLGSRIRSHDKLKQRRRYEDRG
jgi:hypothetical protein